MKRFVTIQDVRDALRGYVEKPATDFLKKCIEDELDGQGEVLGVDDDGVVHVRLFKPLEKIEMTMHIGEKVEVVPC